MRAGVKPAGQVFTLPQRTGLARKVGEHRLRHVLRQMRVAIDLPERGGIHQIHVPPDQFGKGILRIRFGEISQQFGVGCHGVQVIAPAK